MSSPNTIQNELRSLNSNLPLTISPSFYVPEGYFEGLAATILVSVKSSEAATPDAELSHLSPLLAGLSKAMPYSVPSFYFDENLQNTPVSQTETAFPVLPAVGKALPYGIPAGYFDGLPQQILAKVSEPTAKVVPLFRQTWMRVAAAAVIAGGLIVGGLQIFSTRPAEAAIAVKPMDTASTLIAEARQPVVQEIKKLSTKDLQDFVENVPATAAVSSKKQAPKNEAAELLKDVSVNEMESFLSAVPQTDDDLSATYEQ